VGKVRAEGYGECAVRVLYRYGGGMRLGEGAVLCQVDEQRKSSATVVALFNSGFFNSIEPSDIQNNTDSLVSIAFVS